MSCTKNQLPRPVRGNAFNIAVKVVARRLDGTVIDDFELSPEDVLNIVYRGTLTPTAFTIEDNNVAQIHFDGTQAAGMYGVDFGGVWEGEPWRFALPIIFQVVDQTSQGWLPKDGIIVAPTYEVVASITIATVGSTVQSDWDENNPTNPAYIKNKPTVYTQQQTDALVALERQARQQADTTLDGKITANTNAIGAEETRAKAAEKKNADDIDNIEAVIPAQASAQNQLADKNFVNSALTLINNTLAGKANSADLATVATSGSYEDLTDKPTIPDAQIQSDWNQSNTSAKDFIKNKPTDLAHIGDTQGSATIANFDPATDCVRITEQTLSSAAQAQARSNIGAGTSNFSGSYNDLTNKPTIPAAQVNSDWNASSGVSQILNKPTIPDVSGKADKVVVVDASTLPASLDPNKVYQLGTLTGSVTIPAFSSVAAGDTEAKIWCFTFSTSTTAPTITWPAAITGWSGGNAPTINASKSYEVTVMDGIGVLIEA